MDWIDYWPENDDGNEAVVVGELTAAFVVAARMTDEEITPDSRVADGIRAVLAVLAQK